jgi:hypothetical protein
MTPIILGLHLCDRDLAKGVENLDDIQYYEFPSAPALDIVLSMA